MVSGLVVCGEVHERLHCLPFPAGHLTLLSVAPLPLEALSIGAHRPWPTWNEEGEERRKGGRRRRKRNNSQDQ